VPVKTFQEQYITDRTGRQTHVILPVELYERLRPLLDNDDFAVTEAYIAQERVATLEWDAPEMDAYDDL
jgi:predicted DNA-binding protein